MSLVCNICAEQLFLPENDVQCIACGHMFHSQCLTDWFKTSKTCPQCRGNCDQQNVIKIYFEASLDTSMIDVVNLLEQKQQLQSHNATLRYKLHNANAENDKVASKTQYFRDQARIWKDKWCNADEEINILKCKLAEIERESQKTQFFQTQTQILNDKLNNATEEIKMLKAESHKEALVNKALRTKAETFNDKLHNALKEITTLKWKLDQNEKESRKDHFFQTQAQILKSKLLSKATGEINMLKEEVAKNQEEILENQALRAEAEAMKGRLHNAIKEISTLKYELSANGRYFIYLYRHDRARTKDHTG